MAESPVVQHSAGNFKEALAGRLTLLEDMHRDDPGRPHLLSAIALGHEREGNRGPALEFAQRAFRTEAGAAEPESAGNASLRAAERPAAALHAGIVFMREAARIRLARGNALEMQREAVFAFLSTAVGLGLQFGKWDRPHQWEVNAASRFSNIEATQGNGWRALRRGIGAVGLGFLSESPRWVHGATPELSAGGRIKAKRNAVLRGVGAIGIALLATVGAEQTRDKLLLRIPS